MNVSLWLISILVLISSMGASSRGTEAVADDQALLKLNGTWLFVEDRTEGRPAEEGGAPMSVRFSLRGEEDAVIYPRPRGDEKITLDGSVIEVREGEESLTRYSGQWNESDKCLEYTMEKTRLADATLMIKLTRIFKPTDEGLLVTVMSDTGSKQVALYRHPEDIQMPEPVKATIADLGWLSGDWVRSTTNSEVEERWTDARGGAMLGQSRTFRREKMTGFEFLRIVERDGGLVYLAQPGGREPTEFVLAELSETRAVFVNPRHDYPQRIVYERTEDGGLKASIGFAIGRLQHFQFKSEPK